MELAIQIQIEELPEGLFLATSDELPGLVAQGRSRGMAKAMAWMAPFIADKKGWPKPPDVMYDKDWPVRQPCLVFAGVALDKPEYIALWKKLDADPTVEEVLRNLPVRQPVLWF